MKVKYYIVYERKNGIITFVDSNIYKGWDTSKNCPNGCFGYKGKTCISQNTKLNAEAIRDALILISQSGVFPGFVGSARITGSDLNHWVDLLDDLGFVKYNLIVGNNEIEMHIIVATEYLGCLFFDSAGILKLAGLRGVKNTGIVQPVINATPSLSPSYKTNTKAAILAFETLMNHHRLEGWRKHDYIAYLDGSFKRSTGGKRSMGGYGFAVFKKTDNGRAHEPYFIEWGKITNTEYLDGGSTGTELFCFNKFCDWIASKGIATSSILTCFDNDQAFWQIKGSFGENSASTKAFSKQQASSSVKASDLKLNWTKSHEGEFGNELVDRLAELGTASGASKVTTATWKDIQDEGVKKGWTLPICVNSTRSSSHPQHRFVFNDNGACYGTLFPNKQSPMHPSVRIFGNYENTVLSSVDNWKDLIMYL